MLNLYIIQLTLADTTSLTSSTTRHTLEHVNIPDSLLKPQSMSPVKSVRQSFLSDRPNSRPLDSTDMKFRHLSMLSSQRGSQVGIKKQKL